MAACKLLKNGLNRGEEESIVKALKNGSHGNRLLAEGICCLNGWGGIVFDSSKGLRILHELSKEGKKNSARAQHYLGDCYENGIGVDEDTKQAVIWFKKAAQQGDACSQFNLEFCYYNGEGVDINMKQAVMWYKKAAEQEHDAA